MGIVSVIFGQAVKNDLVGRRKFVEVLGESVVVDSFVGPCQDFKRNLLICDVLSLVFYQKSCNSFSEYKKTLSDVTGTLGDLLANIG